MKFQLWPDKKDRHAFWSQTGVNTCEGHAPGARKGGGAWEAGELKRFWRLTLFTLGKCASLASTQTPMGTHGPQQRETHGCRHKHAQVTGRGKAPGSHSCSIKGPGLSSHSHIYIDSRKIGFQPKTSYLTDCITVYLGSPRTSSVHPFCASSYWIPISTPWCLNINCPLWSSTANTMT